MRYLIGLAGPAGSGKTTIAEYISDVYDYYHDSFAAPIRAFSESIGLGRIQGDDRNTEKTAFGGLTRRQIEQQLGTEWARKIDSEFWIKALHQRSGLKGAVVISDVRFENEARYIRDRGGLIIHLRGRGGIDSDHISENRLDLMPSDEELDNSHELGDVLPHLFKIVDTYEKTKA